MKKILFFISSLYTGGKERRLIELMSYLKKQGNYKILLVSLYKGTGYPKLLELQLDWRILYDYPEPLDTRSKSAFKFYNGNFNNQYISNFLKFKGLVKEFDPDIIHTWGRTETFYAIPSAFLFRKILVNSQITSAPPKISTADKIINFINFKFSDIILANSLAGIEAFQPPKSKAKVIYNGMTLDRFKNLPEPSLIKKKYNIQTEFAVVMVATLSRYKNQKLFFQVGQYISNIRSDITFLSVGFHGGDEDEFYSCCKKIINDNPLLKIIGEVKEVEAIVNCCDIGVLFSNLGEGVSNSILENLALGKPVIANDTGGNSEVIQSGVNGFLIQDEDIPRIAEKITELIDNPKLKYQLGEQGRTIVKQKFSIEKMGLSFEALYNELTKFKLNVHFNPISYK